MEKEIKVEPRNSENRIIFMFMYNDIDRTRKDNQQVCVNNSSCVAEVVRNFSKGQWSFVEPRCEGCAWQQFCSSKFRIVMYRYHSSAFCLFFSAFCFQRSSEQRLVPPKSGCSPSSNEAIISSAIRSSAAGL